MPVLPSLPQPIDEGVQSPLPWLLFLGLLALLTVAAIVVGNGNPAVALAPCLIALVLWALWVLPLRAAMLTLLVLSWTLEIPGGDFSASSMVQMPQRVVGALLFTKLNGTIPVDSLVFSGLDVLLLVLAAVVIYRHTTRSRIDRVGWVEAPRPIRQFAVLALLAVAWMTIFGLSSGGSFRFSLWQITKHLYLPLIYLKLLRRGDSLKAGVYEFDKPISAADVLDKVIRGDVIFKTVTVREGLDRFAVGRLDRYFQRSFEDRTLLHLGY